MTMAEGTKASKGITKGENWGKAGAWISRVGEKIHQLQLQTCIRSLKKEKESIMREGNMRCKKEKKR